MPVQNPQPLQVLDEGVVQGVVTKMDFTGTTVTATVSGTTATVNVTSGSGESFDNVLAYVWFGGS